MSVKLKTGPKLESYQGVDNYGFTGSSARSTYPGIYSPWLGISGIVSWGSGELSGWFTYLWFMLNEYVFSNLVLFGALGFFVIFPSNAVFALKKKLSERELGMLFKRAVDVAGAVSGLLLCFPVFIILPVLIKLDSPGPVFFRQLRVGFNRRRSDRRSMEIPAARDRRSNDRRQNNLYGKPFMIYKFRTMRQDAEKHSGPVWASKNDPRITPLGRFLRASRLDEIPQLINVLRGEMSLVGPRPERPYFIEKLRTQIDSYESRMNVKPGITGLAQVEHGYDQDIDDVRKKVNFDLEYIRRWNVYHDFKIMLKTVVVMVGGRGM